MKKLLIVIDMQNDFIDGNLGSPEAQAIVPKVVNKIKNWDGTVWATQDTHNASNYFKTKEGKKLPVLHCVVDTSGWFIHDDVAAALVEKNARFRRKYNFADLTLPYTILRRFDYVEIIGLCTDICVISNAMLIKTMINSVDVAVDAECCAGTTPEMHDAALKVMKNCQIEIL